MRPNRLPRFPTSPLWLCAAAIALGPSALAQEGKEPAQGRKLRGVRIGTHNIFAEQAADSNWFYWFFNALHFPTDPEVVERDIWFEPGARVSDAEI